MARADARLWLRRSGGLAGVALEADLDTSTLDETERAAVLGALDIADLPALAGRPATPPVPDAFTYELRVRRGGAEHRLAFAERDAPAALGPVVAALRARARPAGRH
ncbi:hypothetical protein FSW04_12850 [Baekduia soli]|uniref:Uncharacterized protein n=1 Tax=Baekduia soli TaxID=496014 RepID=A0A5B8U6A3_9ACTN|nr:protealysin inhibitor emfourin [Baekduia soli]QEC48368.1 hypothetical protein FSW04_12850 [Baekduia soli]